MPLAATAVLIAAASKNLVKEVYSYCLADRKTGIESLPLLAALRCRRPDVLVLAL